MVQTALDIRKPVKREKPGRSKEDLETVEAFDGDDIEFEAFIKRKLDMCPSMLREGCERSLREGRVQHQKNKVYDDGNGQYSYREFADMT